MSDPMTGDPVVISSPARSEFVHVIRAVSSSVAARANFSYDAVEDVRLAVDEASAMLLSLGPTSVTVEIRGSELGLELFVRCDASVSSWPTPGLERSLSWMVLSALVDEVLPEVAEDGPGLRLRKRNASR